MGRVARVIHHLWPVLLTGTLLGLGWLGLVLLPVLVGPAPLLLIALRPTWGVLVLVGGSVPFLPALLIATVLRCLLDVGYYALARNNVRSLLLRSMGGGRLVAALTRPSTQTPLLWFCLVNTNVAVDAALGAAGVPMRRFLRFLVPGSALSSLVYLSAARAVTPWMRDGVDWLDARMTWFVLGGLALAIVRLVGGRALRLLRSRRHGADRPLGSAHATPYPDNHFPHANRDSLDMSAEE
ncbi:hypothetical protein MXD60_12415 [Frankia sp. AgB32]|nr:hypothetical protein [Frankia sp. AgB32]